MPTMHYRILDLARAGDPAAVEVFFDPAGSQGQAWTIAVDDTKTSNRNGLDRGVQKGLDTIARMMLSTDLQ